MCESWTLITLLYSEDEPGWDIEIQDDVIEECNKHGGVVHVYVDKNSSQVSIQLPFSDRPRCRLCVAYIESVLFFRVMCM